MTARAVAALPVLVEYAAPLLRADGVLVAWKGARARDEEEAGAGRPRRSGSSRSRCARVVPFEGARDRHLHVFRKVAPTPERFPRRPGMAAEAPAREPFGTERLSDRPGP